MDGRFTRDDSELLNGSPRFLSKDDDRLQLSIYRIAEGHWVFALHAEGGARSPTQSAESPTKSPIDSEPAALGFRTNGIVRWPHHAHSWEEWFEDNSQDGGQWYLAKGLDPVTKQSGTVPPTKVVMLSRVDARVAAKKTSAAKGAEWLDRMAVDDSFWTTVNRRCLPQENIKKKGDVLAGGAKRGSQKGQAAAKKARKA